MSTPGLRDLGGYVPLLLSRPLRWFWFNRDLLTNEEPTTAEDIRSWTRDFPKDRNGVQLANLVRVLGWASVLIVGLAFLAPLGLLTGRGGERGPAAVIALTILTAVVTFASGACLAGAGRLAMLIVIGRDLDWMLSQEQGSRRRRGLLLRLCLPSNAELLFALIWASWLTLGIFELIVRPGG
jgi:hypothetical protein